jgi:hypothetical protein
MGGGERVLLDTSITGGPVRRSVTSSKSLPAALSISLLSQALRVALAALVKQRPPGFTHAVVSDLHAMAVSLPANIECWDCQQIHSNSWPND